MNARSVRKSNMNDRNVREFNQIAQTCCGDSIYVKKQMIGYVL